MAARSYAIQDLDQPEDLELWMSNGITLDLSENDTQSITFKVKENATTGFKWSIDPSGCPESVATITQTFDAPIQFDEEEPLMGAGGMAYFEIEAEDVGTCDFTIAYARGWMFSWTDEAKWDNYERKISIPVSVV